ncbi:MAG TPA: beta-ketoacyl-[acyl-carrier-protein] synthase family protein [Thermoanaerobaculia bacterium]|nr:beta-ketoacyl-[acyl-carrier-protein] synthase family protein [Thermoanaerobaculia bacterium]
MTRPRVVVTGLGVISAAGHNRHELWDSLHAGRTAIAQLEGFPLDQLRFRSGAQVRGYEPRDHFDRQATGILDRFAQFLIIAAREAVADAELELGDGLAERTAIVTGSSMGGQMTMDECYLDLYGRGHTRSHPLSIPRAMANAGASQLALEFGITGPTFTLSTACASSNHALGQALALLRSGQVEAALAGGSEAPFCWGSLKAWEAVRAVDPEPCRPFARDRHGMSLGEGGAVLVLETEERARTRGARIYGELAGFGMSADAHHITHPSVDGPARALTSALRDAGWSPEEVGHINAHGTGTEVNDLSESQAIHAVFGEQAERIAVTSTKSIHGHGLGAAGALEAVATLLTLIHGTIPPTANTLSVDPECRLDVVTGAARPCGVRRALSSSFAFGGLNAVAAFAAWEGGRSGLNGPVARPSDRGGNGAGEG